MKTSLTAFFNDSSKWQKEYAYLRKLILETEVTEEFKWGKPCYTINGTNVVLIHGFKDYCALLFHKGVLLKDPKGLLIQQTENVQSARQLRFVDLAEIKKLSTTIVAYVNEAIALEKAGKKVTLKTTAEYAMPEELTQALKEDAELSKAFKALTPGRQRGYLLHFAGAKQSKTRVARIEKSREMILEGKGLNDQ